MFFYSDWDTSQMSSERMKDIKGSPFHHLIIGNGFVKHEVLQICIEVFRVSNNSAMILGRS